MLIPALELCASRLRRHVHASSVTMGESVTECDDPVISEDADMQ